MKIFDFFLFKKKDIDPLTLEKLVEIELLSKSEMLSIKRDRALREYERELEKEIKPVRSRLTKR